MTTESRKKLDRMPTTWVGGHYTTGDAQHWTYEYTWEDVLAIVEFERDVRDPYPRSSPPGIEFPSIDHFKRPSRYDLRIFDRIVDYFKEHQQEFQKLLESEILAEKGLNFSFGMLVDPSLTLDKYLKS